MKKEEIIVLFKEYEQAACEINQVEYWNTRNLCVLLGYTQWQDFTKVIAKAKETCRNVDHNIENHFIDVNKMVMLDSGAQREIYDNDIMLPAISIKAKDFAAEMTSVKVQTKDLCKETPLLKSILATTQLL